MLSVNFEILRRARPVLASLGGFAEQYAHPDPVSALIKLRLFGEQMVLFIYQTHSLPKPYQAQFNDLLNESSFKSTVPKVVLDKLHGLRLHGNKAAHGETVDTNKALWNLREAYNLACWYFLTYCGGTREACPPFVSPTATPKPDSEKETLKGEKKAALEKLAAQEAQMQKLLDDLESARAKAAQESKSNQELQAILKAAQTAADVLKFDEDSTRKKLIDESLIAAGWDVGANGAQTEEVGQEVEVPHQPTSSEKGNADYVLWGANGKPLAVIEAKKTAKDADQGRTQARIYADGLEKVHGQRPIIFYTNGFDIFIWNDAGKEPPRQIYGFYSKDSLEYLHFQLKERKPLATAMPNPDIAGRMYQIETIRHVLERFEKGYRKALIVLATGTGKTRVAVSLCETLMAANRAKRILFLCDRLELRKQADGVYKEYLKEPRAFVDAITSKEQDKRIYLATYPAMMKSFERFDVGFFDLIIADESHRSIYNRYREIFLYFDCFQVGLTATPVKFIARNTYKLFGCEDQDPTAFFGFEDAIQHSPPYLVPFEVYSHTTKFLRDGIKYSEMSEDQKQALEEDDTEAETVEFEAGQVDKQVINKDTNRAILRNLMEKGIRDKTGARVGKTIIFARNHRHAKVLEELFDEMYPQYGGTFCQVIDNYDPRAAELIDDFKGLGSNPNLTIAISVDMLDTGIDVPEIVNLVFAKPVKSFVKFWQMIGRGTRLCENLFGLGQHKTEFRIFDHWNNFEFFGEGYEEAEPKQSKALLQQLFEARIELAETALQQTDIPVFELAVKRMGEDIAALPSASIAIKERWKEVKSVGRPEVLKSFAAATKASLKHDIAPLMQWRDVAASEAAYRFDLLMTRLQIERLKSSAVFTDLKDTLLNQVQELQMNLTPVQAKAPAIQQIKPKSYWDDATVKDLETLREELRGIMQYRQIPVGPALGPKIIDVKEDPAQIEYAKKKIDLEGLDLAAYRNRVEKALRGLFEKSPTLQKIKSGAAVTKEELSALVDQVLLQDATVNLQDLLEVYPKMAPRLDLAIRCVIGLDAEAVHKQFTAFVQAHPLNAHQIKFLSLLENHIAQYGSIELDRLYEPPFTTLHSDGLDGVFTDEKMVSGLLNIIQTFTPKTGAA